jgi:type II secretory pathway pseudopilin PulG
MSTKQLPSGSSGGRGERTCPGRRLCSAFSLIEIMVAVTLMSVIILGLMAMFSQTQKAFRLGMNQTDVLESGRVATDLIVREIEQITPAYLNWTNVNSPTFYGAIHVAPGSPPVPIYPYVRQALPGGSPDRENVFHDLYFLTRENQTWTGIGYYVRTNPMYSSGCGPVGTLYRIEGSCTSPQLASGSVSLQNIYFDNTNNVSRMIDGVIHFRVRAFDTNGVWITTPWNATPAGGDYWWGTNNNVLLGIPIQQAQQDMSRYIFYSNAVPAFVEIEIGVLEQQTYERYRAIPNYAAQTNYLAKHAGNVHVFRQRVPVRNVDVTAYQ